MTARYKLPVLALNTFNRRSAEGEETKKRGKKHARKQGQNAQNLNPELVTEEMNMDVVNAAINAETIDAEDDQPGVDQNRAFDTLKDIENLKKDKKEDDYKPADGAEDEAKKLADLRLKVFKARTGNLYRAVIHASKYEATPATPPVIFPTCPA